MKKRRLLSLILTMCMVLSLVPMIAFASGESPVQIEVKNAQNGYTQYKINEGDWIELNTSQVWDVNSVSDGDTVTVRAVPNEGQELDTTGTEFYVNGYQETIDCAALQTDAGWRFTYTGGSVYQVCVEYRGGGSGDPQPSFTPGIRINDRGVPLTVVGAASPQNDGNYTFDENVTTATVTFTDVEDRVRGLAVRVFDSNGLVSSNRLQQKTYTINDVNKFYEIEVIDYNAIFDNQYRADYDNSDGKTVKVGDVTLDGNNARTFEKGQTITFIASEVPGKVVVRPNDDRAFELEITDSTFTYTPTTDAGFELKVYWSEDEYNYDLFEGTDALPIVVEYTKDSDTALTLSGAEIADADKITCGNNTKVRVASNVTSLTFDWGANTPKRICVEGDEEDPQGTSYTLDLTLDTKTFYRLEFRWNDDPEPDWHTVSWDGGNVTVENGTVTAERVHLGDKTFTVNVEESGASDSDNIFPIEDIIGQQGLGQYGLGYSDTDLFIGNDVTEEVSIDFKFVPDYGYQLSDILTNGENSLLSGFTASRDEISTFNFEVRSGGSVHFNVVFAAAEDTIDVENSNKVTDASIDNGGNAIDSGNLKLTVADLDENAVSEDLKARAGESSLYLDMNLYQVVSKASEAGNWETQLEDLPGTITVTLEVPAPAEGSSYYIIREHGDGADRTYSRIEVTFVPDANDPTKGTVTFETDKFSNYALAQAAESAATADFTASDNGAAALALLNAAKTGSDESEWDSTTKTLTLKGVNFTTTATIAVKLPEDATIVLVGDNTITSARKEAVQSSSYGIYAEEDLTIQGNGTLTAEGGTAGRYNSSFGIYSSEGSVTIDSGTVNANGGTSDGNSIGIYACNDMTINGGTVTATGGAAEASQGESYGVYAYNNVIIKSGTVRATGGTATGYDGESYGIHAYKDVTIEGGRVEATGGEADFSEGIDADNNVFISGEATDVTATGGKADYVSHGIYAWKAVTINNGIVTATGSEATGEYGESCGIYAYAWENNDVTISGGRVKATSGKAIYSYGIYSDRGDLTIENSAVEATGSEADDRSFGIYVCDDVTIESGTVTATGGKASEYSDGIYAGLNVAIKAGTVTAEAGEAGIESYGIEAYNGSVTISGGHVTAQTLDESGTYSALNKTPTLPTTYYWRISNSGDYKQYPGSAYTWDAAHTYVEISDTEPTDTITYTITLNAGGGTVATTGMTTGTDGKLTEALPTPTRNGYTFDGWFTAAEGGEKVTADTVFTESTTIYSHWTKNDANPFVDVASGAYYYNAVMWAVKNEITNGTSDTTFSPGLPCTRAQIVTFLWRASGCPTPQSSEMAFTDVAKDRYYYDAVMWAVEKGITNGTSATTFSPDIICNRAQIVTFLWRSQGKPAAGTANPFKDVAAGAYYTDAVMWAVENDITEGTSSTTFSPYNDCTRAQIVTFLYRCLGK